MWDRVELTVWDDTLWQPRHGQQTYLLLEVSVYQLAVCRHHLRQGLDLYGTIEPIAPDNGKGGAVMVPCQDTLTGGSSNFLRH